MEDPKAYWCFTHQRVEPVDWAPHPDHLRIGPMTLVEAQAWPGACPPWRGPVLPLADDPEHMLEVA